MKKLRLVLFLGRGESSNMLYNALKHTENYDIVGIINDVPIPKSTLVRNRIKRLGFWHTMFQLLFQLVVCKILHHYSKDRIKQICDIYNLDSSSIDMKGRYLSINDVSNIDYVNGLSPDLIIVNGTRIISKTILEGINSPIINIHVGITPKYRGVHGAYWAYYNNDADNAGTTIHFVDSGIDSGKIIKQGKIIKDTDDTFVTYPYLQIAKGIDLIKQALEDFSQGQFVTRSNNVTESHLYYHPTIFEYLYGLWYKRVK